MSVLRNTVLERVHFTSAADRKKRSLRSRGPGHDSGSQTSNRANSETCEQASGSTTEYEGGVGSLSSG